MTDERDKRENAQSDAARPQKGNTDVGNYCCDDIRELLPEYIDGEANEEVTAAVETHMKTCAGCRRQLDELLWLRTRLSELKAEPPSDMHGKIMQSVHSDANAVRAGRRRRLTRILAAAAVFVLVVGSVFTIWRVGFLSQTFDNFSDEAAPGAEAEVPGKPDKNDFSVGDVEDGNFSGGAQAPGGMAGESLNQASPPAEVFALYGKDYDGGYVIYASDSAEAKKLAELFDAEYNDEPFTVQLTEENAEVVKSLGAQHFGSGTGEQCVIVYVNSVK